jgi:choline dehydrogenase-like flavoprotein
MKTRPIVVIGAGLAGSVLCNELARHADVTLLEVGEKNRIHYPPIGFDRKRLSHVNTFCFGGGGTTNLWHNGLVPINRADVLSEEFRQVLAESEAFMNEAAAQLFFRGRYAHSYQEAVSQATAVAKSIGLSAHGVDCLIYPKKHKPLSVDARVNGVYGVDRIRFLSAGARIDTIVYTAGSREYSLDPAAVVVAAGAMGSPRILRDIIAATGHRFDGLGTGFIDHPLGFVGKVRIRKEAANAVSRLSLIDRGDYVIRSAIRLKSDCGRYTCCAFLRPALTMHNSLHVYRYKSLLGATNGLTRVRNALSWMLFHPDIVAEVYSHLSSGNIPGRTYNILFVAEQRSGSSRVYYDGDQLRVDWSISEEELSIYRALLTRLASILEPLAEQINIETALTQDWLSSGAHHSRTTPLGDTAGDLVDRNLKLRFCDNVFVCDGSVIQEHSYANTGLTIGQLALRLARHLLSQPVVGRVSQPKMADNGD